VCQKKSNIVKDMHNRVVKLLVAENTVVLFPHLQVSRLARRENSVLSAASRRDLVDSAQFKFRLACKSAARYVPGACLVQTSEAWSTQTCPRCRKTTKVYGSRTFTCKHCAFTVDRDANGCNNTFTLTLITAAERRRKGEVPFGAPIPDYIGSLDGGQLQQREGSDQLVNNALSGLAADERVAMDAAVAAVTGAAALDAADPGFAAATATAASVRKAAGQALHAAAAGRACADLWYGGTRKAMINAVRNKAIHRIITFATAAGAHAAVARGLCGPVAVAAAGGCGDGAAAMAAAGDVDMVPVEGDAAANAAAGASSGRL
jgi:hypothetical protein